MGAFKIVATNINDVGFTKKLNAKDKYRYQQLIAKVFLRLDEYFTQNKFYSFNDYNAIVDTIIKDHTYVFDLSNTLPRNIYGRFQRKNLTTRGKVMVNSRWFYDGVETEACLCHEVIHLFTTGADVIKYSIPGGQVELVLPDNIWVKAGYKKVTKHFKTTTEILTYADVAQNNFLKEGLTELLKQQIYPITEAKPTYPIQTSFIKLLNQVCKCDLRTCFKDFLQGDLVTYKKVLGTNAHKQLEQVLDVFMMEYKMEVKTEQSVFDSANLQDAYQIVLTQAFRDFKKSNPSIYDVIKFVEDLSVNIISFKADTVYNSSAKFVTEIFKQNVTCDSKIVAQFQEEYRHVLQVKEDYEWYKAERNHYKGFKVTGFSENIYLIPGNNYTRLNTLIYTENVMLSKFLNPEKVGEEYVYNPGDYNVAPLLIKKETENCIVYAQGDVTKKVVIKDDRCFIYDKDDNILDSGYIAYSGNAELKEKHYEKQIDKFNQFIESVMPQTEDVKAESDSNNVEM